MIVVSALFWSSVGRADDADEALILPDVVVTGTQESAFEAASQHIVTERDLELQAVDRPANVLRLVPGLITTNPGGGPGKPDNYLLRGFDADHGTDLAGFLDGMPLNLRSHAHGQGYLDLNFLIPETMKRIDAHKGPYQVQFGDFATAGAVNFVTRDMVEEGVVQASGGQFNTQRHLLMFSPTKDQVRSLVALEGFYTDGPFVNPNRALRLNGLAKATMNPTAHSELSIIGTYYQGRWNSPGEIPLRTVESGLLSRFGSVDPYQGGRTQRSTGHVRYRYDTPSGGTVFAATYLQYYALNLVSDFTFFLTDPVNGDGIEQVDRRYVYGGEVGYRQSGKLLNVESSVTVGVQTRRDDAEVRLGTQRQWVPLGTTSDSRIHEASYSPYLRLEFQPAPWARLTGGTRADYFQFNVRNLCQAGCPQNPSGSVNAVITTTKGNLILGPWAGTEIFLNAGTGFHSNDARAVVSASNVQALPKATAYEVGIRTRPWDRLEVTASFWLMDLTSELVYQGNLGTTQILGATRRYGMDLGSRIQLLDWLSFSGSATLNTAEFRETGNPIPQAPTMTGRGELTARLPTGLAMSLQMVHLGARPLTQDRSINAQAWTIFNFVARYRPQSKGWWQRMEGFLSIQNIFDVSWRQTQLAYETKLTTDAVPVNGLQFTPGGPRTVSVGLAWHY
ncbi:TonB-dependent receptor [Nitrospira defluvii]|nr:TonB-dependent receptor plug domain-containing protein [Nitrospira defluvii]